MPSLIKRKYTVCIVLALSMAALALAWAAPAYAQQGNRGMPAARATPTGDPFKDIGNAIRGGQQQAGEVDPMKDLADKIARLSLADFTYAAALAHATGNKVSAPCWDAWVTFLSAQQQPLKDAAGNVLSEPDPHIFTSIERLSEAMRQLQPDSDISIGCSSLASAVKKDAATLIGAVLSGGALGLFKLPVIP